MIGIFKRKDVSEPVLTFVKLFIKYPNRWAIKLHYESYSGSMKILILKDRCTGEVFRAVIYHGTLFEVDGLYLTDDEINYLTQKIRPLLVNRREKYLQIKASRSQREGIKRRDKLKALYCGRFKRDA